ncbi:hypothetical protein CCR85_07830 [Rhodothalassium salexigens]|uniref:alpha/beta fold hydrolase BchO n=1 Tax=Rhodothalassium salexigens TaxID=1086 RepID=UPI001913EFE7|nr:alpha/beta fold hydrolase BchO [Rhodothalassium salexigens]MBK5911402.1 hypothetical protein [Rhodothalassium salexigens]MBK5920229.1 hypothetical protein [Rhodothalassium salexigens]
MLPAFDKPLWARDGAEWPNHEASRFVEADGLAWHVQVMGPPIGSGAPVVLLIHGTGAASHSWRDVAPILARTATVIVPDLPGHGFTETPPRGRLGLAGMAVAVRALARALDVRPCVAVGHSAGTAILMRAILDGGEAFAPRALIGFNSALFPFRGEASQFFSPLAKMLALNPVIPAIAAFRASDEKAIRRLIEQTGSTIDARGLDCYRRLMRRSGHVSATLAMMANWDLAPLGRQMGKLACPVTLVVGTGDTAVPPAEAEAVAERLAHARIVQWPDLGHLAHEEAPQAAADLIAETLASVGGQKDAPDAAG